jgi:hypothetical protein
MASVSTKLQIPNGKDTFIGFVLGGAYEWSSPETRALVQARWESSSHAWFVRMFHSKCRIECKNWETSKVRSIKSLSLKSEDIAQTSTNVPMLWEYLICDVKFRCSDVKVFVTQIWVVTCLLELLFFIRSKTMKIKNIFEHNVNFFWWVSLIFWNLNK